MNINKQIKKTILLSLVAGIFLSLPVLCQAAKVPLGTMDYQYKDNHQEEKKKYFLKLNKDKEKIEIAIRSTKALIDRARTKPYLPELYLRLAELYIEKSRVIYFIRKIKTSDRMESLETLEANTLKNQAIEIYQRILADFPDFRDADKVRFFMAHEYRELGMNQEMNVQYQMLIKQHPDSSYAAESFLLMGDYNLNIEKNIKKAIKYYEAVLRYPGSSAEPVALYKLAWCHINAQEFKKAILLLEKSVSTINIKSLDIDTYRKSVDIKLESLIDIAFCYGEAYKEKTPDQAIEYFKNYSWSRPVYMVVLEKLAYRYLIKKKWDHSLKIYRTLSKMQNNPEKLLEYSRNIFECVQALKNFDDAQQDIAFIVKALEKQKYSIHVPKEEKQENFNEYELYARDIVTHLHHKARKNKSTPDFKRAADCYSSYLSFFKDSPVSADMEENYAESLFSSGQYIAAGKQYEKLAMKQTGEQANEAARKMPDSARKSQEQLYSSVLSYYKSLRQKENLSYHQTVYARQGLRSVGNNYIKKYPDSDKSREIQFNVAWVAFDEGSFEQAITEFSNFVDTWPESREAAVAVHLILDAYHLRDDYKAMINYGNQILARNTITSKLRKEINQIIKASESKIISAITLTALDDWDKGRSNLLAYAEENKTSELGLQALGSLIVSSRERGDLETLFSAGNKFINLYPGSAKTGDTLKVLIDSSLKAGQYRMVASLLEKFASTLPEHASTYDFILQAANIRSSLGQNELAEKNYKKLVTLSGGNGGLKNDVFFAMVDNTIALNKTDLAVKMLTNERKYLSDTDKVRADAMLANFHFQSGNIKEAQRFQKTAEKKYKSIPEEKKNLLSSYIARIKYNSTRLIQDKYMGIKMGAGIDNKIVKKKTELLARLEQEYQKVINYHSPEWALSAIYSLYEINQEFGHFLETAPMPALAPEQQVQYKKLINEKVKIFTGKADQYLKTDIEQAHKWELCNPELTKYYLREREKENNQCSSFSANNHKREINDFLKDEQLRQLHSSLSRNQDLEIMHRLAEVYRQKMDFHQAIILSRKILSQSREKDNEIRVKSWLTLGMASLDINDDMTAKDAFKKVLENQEDNIAAKTNLAALLSHYGHYQQAAALYSTIQDVREMEEAGEMIHPRARELYYVHLRSAKK
jgi:cellulose synthase operon protein C